MVEETEKPKEKGKSVYHIDVEPGKDGLRPEWNLIFVSNAPVGIDFHHTDMLEKVIVIDVKPSRSEEEEERK